MSFERKSLFSDELKPASRTGEPEKKSGRGPKADSLDDLFGGAEDAPAGKSKGGGGRLPVKTW